MKRYECLLFDLDGTLIYSHPGIYAGFCYTLKKMGMGEPTQAELKKVIGPPLEYSFEKFFHLSKEKAKEATEVYRGYYAKEGMFQCEPVPEALETLKILKNAGYKLALATSKAERFAVDICKNFGFDEYLDEIVGCDEEGFRADKADVVREAAFRLKIKAGNCLMIGDRFYDILGGRAAGADGAGLDVGYAEEGELLDCEPNCYFRSFSELANELVKAAEKES